MHTLHSTHWRLWLDPEQGVNWHGLQARRGDTWLHLAPDCRESPDEPGPAAGLLAATNFVMLPYSNRIRDGRFPFDGQEVQLQEAHRHAIHGALRKLPWRVEYAGEHRLSCRFDSADYVKRGHAPVNWPWHIEATIEHVLMERRLTSEVSLTNRGRTPMPAGFGWHPYFLREVDGASPWLSVPVNGVFPDANGDCLPDGAPVPLPAELDFRAGRALDPDQRIDNCFAGLDGDILVRWPEANIGLSIRSSPVCRFAIVYNPDEPFFAVEPVTNANDAFNLEARGIDAGQQILEPGATLRATMMFELEG